MEQKPLNEIDKLNNNELKAFFEKNGFLEIVEVLIHNQINGEQLLQLTESEILKWTITPAEKRKFLAFLAERNSTKPDKSKNRRKFPRQNTDIREKLEAIMSQKNLDEYLPMNKPPKLYDDDGYVKILSPQQQSKEEIYVSLPSTVTPPNITISEITDDGKIRKPMVLPRNSTDERGYIQGPALPNTPFSLAVGNPEGLRKIKSAEELIYDLPLTEQKKEDSDEMRPSTVSYVKRRNKSLADLSTNSLDRIPVRPKMYPSACVAKIDLKKRPLPPLPQKNLNKTVATPLLENGHLLPSPPSTFPDIALDPIIRKIYN